MAEMTEVSVKNDTAAVSSHSMAERQPVIGAAGDANCGLLQNEPNNVLVQSSGETKASITSHHTATKADRTTIKLVDTGNGGSADPRPSSPSVTKSATSKRSSSPRGFSPSLRSTQQPKSASPTMASDNSGTPQGSRAVTATQHHRAPDPSKIREREEKIRAAKEKREDEDRKRVEELREAQRKVEESLQRKEEERRQRIIEMKKREEEHRHLVEERKKHREQEEQAKKTALLKRLEEQNIKADNRTRKSMSSFAFGSSTPRSVFSSEDTSLNTSKRAASQSCITGGATSAGAPALYTAKRASSSYNVARSNRMSLDKKQGPSTESHRSAPPRTSLGGRAVSMGQLELVQPKVHHLNDSADTLIVGSRSAPPGKHDQPQSPQHARRSHTDIQKTLERLATPKVSGQPNRSGSSTPPQQVKSPRAPPKTKAALTPKGIGITRGVVKEDGTFKTKPVIARREVTAKDVEAPEMDHRHTSDVPVTGHMGPLKAVHEDLNRTKRITETKLTDTSKTQTTVVKTEKHVRNVMTTSDSSAVKSTPKTTTTTQRMTKSEIRVTKQAEKPEVKHEKVLKKEGPLKPPVNGANDVKSSKIKKQETDKPKAHKVQKPSSGKDNAKEVTAPLDKLAEVKMHPVDQPSEPQKTDSNETGVDDGVAMVETVDRGVTEVREQVTDEPAVPVGEETVGGTGVVMPEESQEKEHGHEKVQGDNMDDLQGEGHVMQAVETPPDDDKHADIAETGGRVSPDEDRHISATVAEGKPLSKEDMYKQKLAEKRREAREKARQEAEERKRQEEEARRLEEEQIQREEEEQRRLEEEQLRLELDARRAEEERLQKAIEETERARQEEERKREAEKIAKEEMARKTLEDEEKKKKDGEEKARKEEEERQERKKRLESIMKRVKNDSDVSPNSPSSPAKSPPGGSTPSADTPAAAGSSQQNSSVSGIIAAEEGTPKFKSPLLQQMLGSKTGRLRMSTERLTEKNGDEHSENPVISGDSSNKSSPEKVTDSSEVTAAGEGKYTGVSYDLIDTDMFPTEQRNGSHPALDSRPTSLVCETSTSKACDKESLVQPGDTDISYPEDQHLDELIDLRLDNGVVHTRSEHLDHNDVPPPHQPFIAFEEEGRRTTADIVDNNMPDLLTF